MSRPWQTHCNRRAGCAVWVAVGRRVGVHGVCGGSRRGTTLGKSLESPNIAISQYHSAALLPDELLSPRSLTDRRYDASHSPKKLSSLDPARFVVPFCISPETRIFGGSHRGRCCSQENSISILGKCGPGPFEQGDPELCNIKSLSFLSRPRSTASADPDRRGRLTGSQGPLLATGANTSSRPG